MTESDKDDLLVMGGQALEIGRRIMLAAANGRLSGSGRRDFAYELRHLAARISPASCDTHRRAETTGSVRSKPERPEGQRPNSVRASLDRQGK